MPRKPIISDEDVKLFRQSVQGINRDHRNYSQNRVEPLAPLGPKRVLPDRTVPIPDDSTYQPPLVDATDPAQPDILFVRTGLQKKVIRRLKRGEYPIESRLDLHGLRLREVEPALDRYLSECLQNRCLCVLIIYGKGTRSAESRGVIRPATVDWLKRQGRIRAFCSALPKDGGSGAAYVLFKKISENRD